MMKKMVPVFILVLCLMCSSAGLSEALPTKTTVPLYTEEGQNGEMTVRFFGETPHVPYMGFNEYMTRILQIPLTPEAAADGALTLKNEFGGELRCDAAAGTVSSPDWVRLITPQMPLENASRSLKDSSCGFVRITEISYSEDAKPVTFDFAKYGMRIYADGHDVYLPLSVLSNMLTDIATHHLRYDGKALYQKRVELTANAGDAVLLNETLQAMLSGEARPADVISQCYADLCFNFDTFFGYPGKAALDPAMAEKGLDGALTDLGAEGAAIKAGLLSPGMPEYLAALQRLFMVWLSDGHTAATDLVTVMESPAAAANLKIMEQTSQTFLTDLLDSKTSLTQVLRSAITPQRKLVWGDAAYREYGNTAIIRLDTFMPDEAAWEAWYRGEGAFPEDCVGSVVRGLRRASENANIKNVIFDLTCNGGGSSDVLMMIMGLTTGRNDLYGRNRLTGQSMHIIYETDNNFDGVFDEKDLEARFDFNYGVLTTRQAFSCGNLFPIVMRESGAAVIGESTGGGSCCIQVGTDTHGIRYVMSSCQWQLLDAAGRDVEGGCTVDIPIVPQSIGLIDRLISGLGVDEGLPLFLSYFDDHNLNTLMNVWFHVQNEVLPAA